ncbi:MAG: hypothetical protein II180_14905 [Proteobacteria bacterium]|nr:hypothetical protein [Pseudomonadota bacterium]
MHKTAQIWTIVIVLSALCGCRTTSTPAPEPSVSASAQSDAHSTFDTKDEQPPHDDNSGRDESMDLLNDPMMTLMADTQIAESYERDGKTDEALNLYINITTSPNLRPYRLTWEYTCALLAVARIYDTGYTSDDYIEKPSPESQEKAFEAYKEILESENYHLLSAQELFKPAARLGWMYEINNNYKSALEWYKRSLEAYHSIAPRAYAAEIEHAAQFFHQQPMFDFKTEIEDEIKAEKDKAPETFPVIKDMLAKCDLTSSFCGSPDMEDRINAAYAAAIRDALTAITAFSLATLNRAEWSHIENTYYDIAIFWGNDILYRDLLKTYAPVCKAILDADLDNSQVFVQKIFHIWYLSHVPKAAEKAFHKAKPKSKWRDYLDKAPMYINIDRETGMPQNVDYKPIETLQPFHLLD